MITIATYRNLMSAELAKTRLESHDIQAMIADDFSYTLGYGSVIDGVRLQVPAEDAGRAKEILASHEPIDLPDDDAIIAESPEAGAAGARTFNEPAAGAASGRRGEWPSLFLFLSGIVCLILGRPTGHWETLNYFSGELILLGELLIVSGLWITYGHLNTAGKDDLPPE